MNKKCHPYRSTPPSLEHHHSSNTIIKLVPGPLQYQVVTGERAVGKADTPPV